MARRTLRALDNRIIKRTLISGAKNGICNISTKEIASILGITEPTIYVHYKTKENLLFCAYKEAVEDILKVNHSLLDDLEKTGKSEEDIRKFLDALVKLDGIEKEKIAYAIDYERNTKEIAHPLCDAFYDRLFTVLNANKEQIPAFRYVLKAIRENAIKEKHEMPSSTYEALLVFLK